MIEDEKWVYTWIGYGKIVESCKGKIVVDTTWGAKLYLQPSSVFSIVSFSVKSFAQNKRLLEFQWMLLQDFSALFRILYKQLGIEQDFVIFLYLPRGQLLQVRESDTPLGIRMKMGSKLIAVAKKV
jgi:hypothetical protein